MAEEVLFARQPIFDTHQRVYAYELLFRHGDVARAEFIDGDLASKSVLLNAYAENNAPQVLNGKPGFLNVTRAIIPAIPSFARQFLVVEILEQEHGCRELTDDIKGLSKRGFVIALDDFMMKNYRPELIDAVDIVKLDVLTYERDELEQAVNVLRQHKVKLLAEKVESYDVFKHCLSLGMELFQGFFFCRPEVVRGHTFDSYRLTLLNLIKEVYREEVDIQKLTSIIKQDAVMSFKLLKLVNSAFYRRQQQVDSISHAVMLLGINRIRSWATLVTLGRVSHKPDELQKESLMRAYMCEKLGESLGPETTQMCFSAGLLSCLDAWFDYPLAELIEMLPLSYELRSAIVEQTGKVGRLLPIAINYIHSNWQGLDIATLEAAELDYLKVGEAYTYAVEVTDSLTAEMAME